jgi:glycosyltransferase involved in cell wall biosynthesis
MLARHYDLAIADSLYMAPYLRDAPLPKLLQAHNVESHLVREFFNHHARFIPRWAQQLEVRHLEAFERDSCNAFDAVIVLSEADRARLQERGVRVPIHVVPPSVDRVARVDRASDLGAVVHLGTLHWPPAAEGLRWYIRNVHPLVFAKAPGVKTLLAGPRPPRDIQALHGREGIRVPGYVQVPESVYSQAAVFIVPLLSGGGVRIKILDALARGLAVVSTSVGCEGLWLVPGHHLLVADEPHAFAEAVVALLRDRTLRERLGKTGRSYVLEQFSPERRCAALARIVRAVAGRASLDVPVTAAGRAPCALP